MLRLYNDLHVQQNPLMEYEGLCISKEVNGEDEITFSCPRGLVKEEWYIRTQDNEFIIKEISSSIADDMIKVVAKINVEELKGTPVKYFETIEKTPEAALQTALAYVPGGWTVYSTMKKRRTLRQSQKTVWDIIQSALDLYMAELKVDAINKTITIESKIGEDKGTYLMESLNLAELNIGSDTYDLVTRIYPVGKDGLTIAEVNEGKEYVENHTWSMKNLAMYWEDNRYTDPESLRDDALEKLESLARPARSYDCRVIELANAANKDIFSYNIGDTVWLKSKTGEVNEKHRIISMKIYPDQPESNTCVLATNLSSLATYIEDNLTASEAVQLVVTQDGRIDSSKVDIGEGAGLPAGGTKGYALVKASDEDYDVKWALISGSGTGLTLEEIEAMITIKSHNIQDGAITNAKIGEAAITEANIADASITRAKIQEGAIGSAQIEDATITGAKIAEAEIDSTHIKLGAIDSARIKDGAITTAKIADAAIDNAKIAVGAIEEANIKDGSITTAKIADAAIDSAKIIDGSINSADIADAAINSAKIGNAAIKEAHIENGAVTSIKIADASITSAKILELDAGLIKTGTLQTERLLITGMSEDGTIKSVVLTLNEINGTMELSSSTIDGGSITEKTITADNIMAGTITSNEIAANTITADNIAAGTITGDQIAAGSITADKLQGHSITIGQLNQSAIDSILDGAKEYTDQQTAYYGQFLNFDPSKGLTIGSGDSDFKTTIDNEKMSFSQADQILAYLNKDKFFITDGEILNSLTLGHYVFIPRQTGNLSIVWRD